MSYNCFQNQEHPLQQYSHVSHIGNRTYKNGGRDPFYTRRVLYQQPPIIMHASSNDETRIMLELNLHQVKKGDSKSVYKHPQNVTYKDETVKPGNNWKTTYSDNILQRQRKDYIPIAQNQKTSKIYENKDLNQFPVKSNERSRTNVSFDATKCTIQHPKNTLRNLYNETTDYANTCAKLINWEKTGKRQCLEKEHPHEDDFIAQQTYSVTSPYSCADSITIAHSSCSPVSVTECWDVNSLSHKKTFKNRFDLQKSVDEFLADTAAASDDTATDNCVKARSVKEVVDQATQTKTPSEDVSTIDTGVIISDNGYDGDMSSELNPSETYHSNWTKRKQDDEDDDIKDMEDNDEDKGDIKNMEDKDNEKKEQPSRVHFSDVNSYKYFDNEDKEEHVADNERNDSIFEDDNKEVEKDEEVIATNEDNDKPNFNHNYLSSKSSKASTSSDSSKSANTQIPNSSSPETYSYLFKSNQMSKAPNTDTILKTTNILRQLSTASRIAPKDVDKLQHFTKNLYKNRTQPFRNASTDSTGKSIPFERQSAQSQGSSRKDSANSDADSIQQFSHQPLIQQLSQKIRELHHIIQEKNQLIIELQKQANLYQSLDKSRSETVKMTLKHELNNRILELQRHDPNTYATVLRDMEKEIENQNNKVTELLEQQFKSYKLN